MSRILALSLVCIALTAPTALAQGEIELSPFFGIRTAGSFRPPESDDPADQLTTFNLDNAPTFGTFVNYGLTRQLDLEFLWGRESAGLVQRMANVQDPDNPTERDLFDLTVSYYHGGVLFSGGNDTYDPYVAAGLGVASFRPDVDNASGTTKLSFSVGVGMKGYVSDRIGFRFEGRAFGTRAGERREDLACGVFGCVSFTAASTFWQSHFIGAVMIRF